MSGAILLDASLTIQLFGPFDVQIGGQPMRRLATRKRQWLLALLALRHGREVQRDWLAGTLWPESDTSQALANLRQSLTELRRALGEQASRLRSTPHTVTLHLQGAEADVLRFEELVAQGDTESLESALRLYRGPLLEGCSEEWVLREREAREQTYRKVLETLAEQAKLRNEPGEAVRLLRLLVVSDPFAEGAYGALMQALAAHGDYAAIPHVYRELRLLLRRELNADPAAETTALFHRLQKEARRRAAPIESSAGPPTPAPASTLAPGNLPQPRTSFIGREQEIEEIRAAVAAARLVTLTGTGGVGKTRLAIRTATELRDELAEDAWFVELTALADPALLPQAMAEALGVREEPGRPLLETLVGYLQPRRILLVLDNCEHLLDACARLADTLLNRCPCLRLLATSREALKIPGEMVWRVPSLPFPLSLRTPLTKLAPAGVAELMRFEAVRLFVERAAAHEPRFALNPENAASVVQVCRCLDGIPLALELAAARVKVLSVAQIASLLTDRFRLLTGGSRSAPPRQQTLRAAVDWSYDLLSEEEQTLLRRLSVFAGGCTLKAVAAVCACSAETAHATLEVLDLLERLVDKSLVMADTQERESRYWLLETIRQYGWEQAEQRGESEALRRRHRDYYLRMAEEAATHLNGPDQSLWLDRQEKDHDNLRAALRYSLEEGTETALPLAAALQPFWLVRGHVGEGRNWLAEALAHRPAPTLFRAQALRAAGVLARSQSDYAAAREYGEASLALFRAFEDSPHIAKVTAELALIAQNRNDLPAARSLFEESLTLCRHLGDKPGTASVLCNLGDLVTWQGEFAAARRYLEEALALDRELGNRHGTMYDLLQLGSLAYHQRDYAEACARYQEGLDISREVGDRRCMAFLLGCLGQVAMMQEQFALARSLYEEALTLHRDLGGKYGIAWTLDKVATLAGMEGDAAGTRAPRAESLALYQEIDDRMGIAMGLNAEAEWLLKRGHSVRATRLLAAAEAIRQSTQSSWCLRDQEDKDRLVETLRAAMDAETFEVAWAEGRAMTPEQAIAYSLESPALMPGETA